MPRHEIEPRTKKKKFIIINVDPDSKQIQLKKKEVIKINTSINSQVNMKRKTEIEKHRDNIRTILLNSNATPIGKYAGIGYACSFCSEQYETPAELKSHTTKEHEKSISNFMSERAMHNYIVKLDITNLKCTICHKEIDTLEQIIDHLKSVHNKLYHLTIKNHILPFKFDSDLAKCVVCGNDYSNFKVLMGHMNKHYGNYVCKECNAGFVSKKTLQTHSYRHKTGIFYCSYCSKIFNTHIKKREHEKAVHVLFHMRSKCSYCGEKFTDYAKKNSHEVKMHSAKALVLQCQACDKTFDNQRSLTIHTKTYHLMEKHIPK